MATATKKAQARSGTRSARNLPELASLEFCVREANGGEYHWEIVGERGESLAQSGSFASYDDAERAARCVRDGAGAARFEPHVTEERQLAAV
jgi:uncharacterized protein YegP (UPF0339 family)